MDRTAVKIFWGAALFWLVVAFANIGFIAIDDYMHGIVLYIPAQFSSSAEIIEASQFRSPLPNLFLFSLSSLALKVGISDPISQLRCVTILVSCLGILGLFVAIRHFRFLPFEKSAEYQRIMALVGGFFFLNPLFMTRPLIESLSVPFLTLCSYFGLRAYHSRTPFWSSLLSMLFLAVACVFRYQVGLWGFAYIALFWSPAWKRALPGLILGGILGLILTGLPDYFMKGAFHSSLKSYLAYNLEHSSIYGTTPFYSYILLLIGLTLPPTLIGRFRGFDWKSYFHNLRPLMWGLAAFVIGHSAVPHKEERFMAPILLLFWLVLTPLLWELKEKKSWRWKYFFVLNALLVLPASFNPPQINTISLVKYIERFHSDKTLYTLAEGNFLFPLAFSANQELSVKTKGFDELRAMSLNCSELVAARYDVRKGFLEGMPQMKEIFVSKPGPLEQLVVWANPGKNARRGPISVYQREDCIVAH